jgi:predicted RNA binding protein YcfA (HicA-like mRNA interferase family)
VADYKAKLIKILKKNGCAYVRNANGSHELWQSPISNKRFVIQNDLKSRVAANNILKQAGIDIKL